ncbi:unnamed protein product [Ambrosiozyma monospora]|uniref:Unnamed protein product n=1 Tax=Ambrosiozyma monospora TaxID=43982 RepID=A0A9W7DI80_AMBMO|nr:unnamed protein product [Ambrosiozyma monospora]
MFRIIWQFKCCDEVHVIAVVGFGNYANLTSSFQSLSETANAADILNINGSTRTNINNSPQHTASFDSTQAQNDPPNDPVQTTQTESHQPTQNTGQNTFENMKASINHLKSISISSLPPSEADRALVDVLCWISFPTKSII